MNLRLVEPGPEHEGAALALLAEFRAAGEDRVYGSGGIQRYGTYADWLKSLDEVPPGGVRQTTFFSFDGDELVGTTGVRHALNERLRRIGGHIGYSIRPSKRRRGYAKEQLRLALDECARLGIPRALVTCEEDNVASAATVAACGGVEEAPCVSGDGKVIRRFWADTGREQGMNLKLVRPGPEHERAVMEYLAEFRMAGENHVNGSGGLHRFDSYAHWLESLDETPPGEIEQTTYLSCDGDELVGTIAVRHGLNQQNARRAGHIGYAVRPSKRRMGYAKAQLRLALDECARLGITHALITCAENNAASAATIAAFDGVEDRPSIDDDGTVIRRFWVSTGTPDYAKVNAEIWDSWVEGGIEWCIPITHEEFQRAKAGDWGVYLTPMRHVPRSWFPDMKGARVLLLAGGGGQQGPIFAALGAKVTVFDNAARQLQTEKTVAEREGYDIRLVKGDMTRRLPFEDGAFDLVFHPVSNCYVENVYHVWRECYRVLKKGGVLLAGMDNSLSFLIGDDLRVAHKLPCNPLRDPAIVEPDDGLQFSHTLSEQIGGQLRAGFRLTDIYDDYDRPGGILGEYAPLYFATRAVKD